MSLNNYDNQVISRIQLRRRGRNFVFFSGIRSGQGAAPALRHRVSRRTAGYKIRTHAAAAILLILTILPVLSAGCRTERNGPSGPNGTGPTASGTCPPRASAAPLQLFENAPISVEEAAAFAARLAEPIERYDALRPGGSGKLSQMERAVVNRVVDGDTLMIMTGGGTVRLRLIGIDAPESYANHDETRRTHIGESVSRIVKAWLSGKTIYLQHDVEREDPYGRLLAYAWLDEHTMINEVLAREGLAEAKQYAPNTHFNDYLMSLERAAKEDRRGIWAGIGQKNGNDPENKHQPKDGNKKMTAKTIYLAGGCFWGVERYYQVLETGVLDTAVGYANGKTLSPTYENVCGGDTGYAETCRLAYDADILPLTDVLAHFFRMIDPTTRDHQGNDFGEQYRPGIYYEDEQDFEVICDYIDAHRKDYSSPIVIEVLPLKVFYPAEDYHQDYLKIKPSGYCHVNLTLAKQPLTPDERVGKIDEPVQPGSWVDYENKAAASSLPGIAAGSWEKPDDAALRSRLTPLQYSVTQENDTERPFTNLYDRHFEEGIYVDIVSGEPLFSSRDKFDSGCGWPAFSKPISSDAVRYRSDRSLWRERTEVRSSGADSHLGHVFEDGPQELGGARYCINSAALRFIPLAGMEKEGYKDYIPCVIHDTP